MHAAQITAYLENGGPPAEYAAQREAAAKAAEEAKKEKAKRKRAVVVGAGPAGLTAASHLQVRIGEGQA